MNSLNQQELLKTKFYNGVGVYYTYSIFYITNYEIYCISIFFFNVYS